MAVVLTTESEFSPAFVPILHSVSQFSPVQTVQLVIQIREAERHKRGRKRQECRTVAIRIDFNTPFIHIESATLPCIKLALSFDVRFAFHHATGMYQPEGWIEVVCRDRNDELLKELLKLAKLTFDYDKQNRHYLVHFTALLLQYLLYSEFEQNEKESSLQNIVKDIVETGELEKYILRFDVTDIVQVAVLPYLPRSYASYTSVSVSRFNGKSELVTVLRGQTEVVSRAHASLVQR